MGNGGSMNEPKCKPMEKKSEHPLVGMMGRDWILSNPKVAELIRFQNEQKRKKMNEMAKNEHKEAITDQTMMRWVIVAEGAPVDSIYLDMAAHEIGPILVVLRALGLKPKVCQP